MFQGEKKEVSLFQKRTPKLVSLTHLWRVELKLHLGNTNSKVV